MDGSCRIGALLKICGLAAFLTALPMDVLTGDTRGFIADSNHFQGWEIVVVFGIMFVYMRALAFVPMLLAAAFTIAGPFIDFSPGTDHEPSPSERPPGRRNWRRIFLAIGAMSVIATAIQFA